MWGPTRLQHGRLDSVDADKVDMPDPDQMGDPRLHLLQLLAPLAGGTVLRIERNYKGLKR